jgi:flagellar hook-length control protein FliK
MLNISIAPQIKSSAETPAAMLNSGPSGTKELVVEEFGKVLEREVSEATNPRETNNTSNEQESSENATPSESEDANTAQAVAVTPDGTNSFIRNLLIDAGNAYKAGQAIQSMNLALNPDAADTTSILPPVWYQNILMPQDGEQMPGSMTPLASQLLQQRQAQPNLGMVAGAAVSNNIWQSLNTADSAAYGNFLPFSSEISESLQGNAGESIFSVHDESISSQPFSLANTASSASLSAVPQDIQVELPVGQPKWGGEFAQKVVWLTSQQHQVAEIRLNPAHLGPVEVMISITQDQATAQFVSPHSAVREAIEAALPKLREMMAESGIQLGNVMVGADSFQQEGRQQQTYHSAKGDGTAIGARLENSGQIEATAVPVRHQGIVNTYA